MQTALWDLEVQKEKKTLAQHLMESKVTYKIELNDNSDMGVLLTAILGNVPDETMLYLLAKPVAEMMGMSRQELLQLKGITQQKASRLIAVFKFHNLLINEKQKNAGVIYSPDDAALLLMDEMRNLDREHFKAIFLNTKNKVIAVETISIGTLNSSAVHPRELFKNAIRCSTANIILVHNHPSGDPSPSREDIDISKRIMEAGQIIGINVFDHIIIGDGKFVSLKSKGII